MDTIVVGQYVGTQALAAVGTTGNIINLLVGFFVGVSSGATVIISQFFGRGIRRTSPRRCTPLWRWRWWAAHHHGLRPADRPALPGDAGRAR